MTERVHSVKSADLGNERPVWVREPREPSQPFGLVMVLDAEIYREHIGAEAVIDALEAGGTIGNTLFVFVSMQSPEARWIECPCYPPFAKFINHQLLPWLEELYPALRTSSPRVLVGVSYTGLAAAYVAMESAGAFTKVVAQSGSFWWNNGWLIERYAQMPSRLPLDFYLDVGLKETDEDVAHKEDVQQEMSQIVAVRKLRDVLTAQGYLLKYMEFDGGHEASAWSKTLPAALQWAAPVWQKTATSG